MQNCFIACVDGLKELPEAIETGYPHTRVQLCIVHQIRNSLMYVTWKDRKQVAADLRSIYTAPTVEAARAALEAFAEHRGERYPAIAPDGERNWKRLTLFFAFPPEIRKVVYTTHAIESLNYSLRKIIKGAWRLSPRRRHPEITAPWVEKRIEKMDVADPELEGCTEFSSLFCSETGCLSDMSLDHLHKILYTLDTLNPLNQTESPYGERSGNRTPAASFL